MIRSFSYEVMVTASPKLAWEIYSNWRRWHTFSNVYGRIEWVGEPWTVGSRMSIEIVHPISITVDHVITHCEPAESVGSIDHALGVAIDQWVVFEPRNGSGTVVRVTGEIVGANLVFPNGVPLEKFFPDFLRQWFEAYREVCNQLAPIRS
ncbi:MAG TPA: SRPBCC family protein [Terriglobales bacterium]|nr:SRPBCC family protein [Terriglobales bacterium]